MTETRKLCLFCVFTQQSCGGYENLISFHPHICPTRRH